MFKTLCFHCSLALLHALKVENGDTQEPLSLEGGSEAPPPLSCLPPAVSGFSSRCSVRVSAAFIKTETDLGPECLSRAAGAGVPVPRRVWTWNSAQLPGEGSQRLPRFPLRTCLRTRGSRLHYKHLFTCFRIHGLPGPGGSKDLQRVCKVEEKGLPNQSQPQFRVKVIKVYKFWLKICVPFQSAHSLEIALGPPPSPLQPATGRGSWASGRQEALPLCRVETAGLSVLSAEQPPARGEGRGDGVSLHPRCVQLRGRWMDTRASLARCFASPPWVFLGEGTLTLRIAPN